MSDSIFPRPGQTGLVVIDVQEKLLPVMDADARDRMLHGTRLLIELAHDFDWPIFYSEQYPKGLGATHPQLLEPLQEYNATRIEKVEFSCARNDVFCQSVLPGLPSHVVVAGMETHICVLQTVADLQARGHQVFVPHDAVASRVDANRRNGLHLMKACGAVETNVESLIFYALQKAGSETFKKFSRLIR